MQDVTTLPPDQVYSQRFNKPKGFRAAMWRMQRSSKKEPAGARLSVYRQALTAPLNFMIMRNAREMEPLIIGEAGLPSSRLARSGLKDSETVATKKKLNPHEDY